METHERLAGPGDTFILGSGLTGLDLLLTLKDRTHKGRLLETTAVPELRVQARELAVRLRRRDPVTPPWGMGKAKVVVLPEHAFDIRWGFLPHFSFA